MTPCQVVDIYKDKDGYGVFKLGGRMHKAHRLAWALHNGQDPAGKVVMHICDNPPCVNPEHLKLGTIKDNLDDMTSKGRRHRPVNNKHRSKITQEIADSIRSLYSTGLLTQAAIGDMYGLKSKAVSKIVLNLRWRKN